MNTQITDKDIKKVSMLARIKLNEPEIERFVGDLNAIVEYAKILQQVDISGVEPMTSPILGVHTPFRDDVVGESLTQEEALKSSPCAELGHFKVPRTVE